MSNIFFDNWDTPWKTLDFQDDHITATELGEDELITAYAELGKPGEYSGVEFGYIDYIDNFHKEHDHINHNLLDDDGHLTREALDKIQKFYQKHLESSRYYGFSDNISQSLEVDDHMGDEPHYVVTLTIPYDAEGTVEEIFDTFISPFYACVQNTTDPGTFNSPYLFSEVQ